MSKTTLKVVSKDEKVIHENFQADAKKVREDCHHTSLKGCRDIAQYEWHASEGECAKRTCECCLLLIVGMNRNLVVAQISVEKAKVTQSCQSVQDLVNEREREEVLLRCGVQHPIVDADSPFRRKACLDLLAFLVRRDHYSSFLWNNVHQTHPLAIGYGVDDFGV